MNLPPTAARPLRHTLLAVAALIAGLLAGCSSSTDSAGAGAAPAAAHEHPATARTTAEAQLHDQMRVLWEQHAAWTRMAIVDFAADSKGFDVSAGRLLKNQVDIGNAIKPYYGPAAGDALTALLKEHIMIAVDVLKAAKAGNTGEFNKANARWYANGNDIADFLAKANPQFWPKNTMRDMMKTHLDQTLAEASAHLKGQYAESAAIYDEIEAHLLDMADGLTAGIVGAFPEKFK